MGDGGLGKSFVSLAPTGIPRTWYPGLYTVDNKALHVRVTSTNIDAKIVDCRGLVDTADAAFCDKYPSVYSHTSRSTQQQPVARGKEPRAVGRFQTTAVRVQTSTRISWY